MLVFSKLVLPTVPGFLASLAPQQDHLSGSAEQLQQILFSFLPFFLAPALLSMSSSGLASSSFTVGFTLVTLLHPV